MMHTPGPWKIFDGWGSDSKKPIIVDSIPDVGGNCVANCICYLATSNDDCLANARLIAAAPEMLEALQAAMCIKDLWLPIGDVSDEHAEELKALSLMAMKFESVIKKATGTDAAQTSAREGR